VTRFNFNGNGCDIHGPFLGPDGRLYWTHGRHGYEVKLPDGALLKGLAARVWRCRTDGTEVERVCGGGFDNPVQIAFTPEGEAIGTMDQGPGDCLLHYVEGGVYPMEHPCLHEFVRTGPLLAAVRQYPAVLPAALCGLTRYRSSSFGDDYLNCFFSTHYMVHKIVRHKLIQEGSTFQAEDQDFLTSSSHDLRITDVLEDADGSLLFVDMGGWFTYGFLGNPLPRPQALGGIYRIRRVGAAPVADPWGKSLNLADRPPQELVAFLNSPRPRVRDRAICQLAQQGRVSVPFLKDVLQTPARWDVQARRNAVWALGRIRTPAARSAVRLALADPQASVRMAAIHAAGLERDGEAAALLCGLVQSNSPPERRKAAEALGRIGRPEAVTALFASLRKGGDRFLEHAIIYALIQINDQRATVSALSDQSAVVRRAGLVAIDQMKDGHLTPQLVAPLLHDADLEVQRAALEVVGRRPAWSALAQAVVRQWLTKPQLSADQQQTLTEFFLAGAADGRVQELFAAALADPQISVSTRLLLVEVFGQHRLDRFPTKWLAALGAALVDSDPAICRAAVTTVKTRNLNQLDEQLAQLSRQTVRPTDLRLTALECLAGHGRRLDAAAFDLLLSHLSETTEPLLRLTAARALRAGASGSDQLIRLARSMKGSSTMLLRLLLPAFNSSTDPAVAIALIEALRQSPAAEALSVAELDRTLQSYPAEARSQARVLRDKLVARRKGQAAYLAALTAELDRLKGNADAGQELFLSAKAACYGCHRAVGRGGTVGPDLSRIGGIRTRAELLESIIFPSFTIAPEYRAFQVATRDGRIITGLITRDTPEALYLRTAELAEIRIARKDVEELTPSAVSLMPEGLEKTMTRQELCNLLEFLCRQR
jgi:putative heme-binding domain-containing protein